MYHNETQRVSHLYRLLNLDGKFVLCSQESNLIVEEGKRTSDLSLDWDQLITRTKLISPEICLYSSSREENKARLQW